MAGRPSTSEARAANDSGRRPPSMDTGVNSALGCINLTTRLLRFDSFGRAALHASGTRRAISYGFGHSRFQSNCGTKATDAHLRASPRILRRATGSIRGMDAAKSTDPRMSGGSRVAWRRSSARSAPNTPCPNSCRFAQPPIGQASQLDNPHRSPHSLTAGSSRVDQEIPSDYI